MSTPETTDFLQPSALDIRPETFFSIIVDKPQLKTIGSTKVVYYEVVTSTDYDGFNSGTSVQRRYSEFQALRQALVAKGAKCPALSWFEWIPKNRSRWEELDEWAQALGTVSYNEDCLHELQRFCNNKLPYQPEKSSSSFLDWLFKGR